jgi:hypothetical protein
MFIRAALRNGVCLGSAYSHLNRYTRSAVARLDLVFAAPSTGPEESDDERQQRAFIRSFLALSNAKNERIEGERPAVPELIEGHQRCC